MNLRSRRTYLAITKLQMMHVECHLARWSIIVAKNARLVGRAGKVCLVARGLKISRIEIGLSEKFTDFASDNLRMVLRGVKEV